MISFEFIIIAVSAISVSFFSETADTFVKTIQVNDEILNWLILVPSGLFVWIFLEAKLLLFPDGEWSKIIHKWPDYRKLKIHFWVSIIYAWLFLVIGLFPLFIKDGLSTGAGFIIFFSSILGELAVALSIYSAQISIREIILHYGA